MKDLRQALNAANQAGAEARKAADECKKVTRDLSRSSQTEESSSPGRKRPRSPGDREQSPGKRRREDSRGVKDHWKPKERCPSISQIYFTRGTSGRTPPPFIQRTQQAAAVGSHAHRLPSIGFQAVTRGRPRHKVGPPKLRIVMNHEVGEDTKSPARTSPTHSHLFGHQVTETRSRSGTGLSTCHQSPMPPRIIPSYGGPPTIPWDPRPETQGPHGRQKKGKGRRALSPSQEPRPGRRNQSPVRGSGWTPSPIDPPPQFEDWEEEINRPQPQGRDPVAGPSRQPLDEPVMAVFTDQDGDVWRCRNLRANTATARKPTPYVGLRPRDPPPGWDGAKAEWKRSQQQFKTKATQTDVKSLNTRLESYPGENRGRW